jgi:hypothetical protein
MNAVMRRSHRYPGLLKLRRIVAADEIGELCRCLRDYGYGHAFAWFYGTAACRVMVVVLKKLFVRLGLSPALPTT